MTEQARTNPYTPRFDEKGHLINYQDGAYLTTEYVLQYGEWPPASDVNLHAYNLDDVQDYFRLAYSVGAVEDAFQTPLRLPQGTPRTVAYERMRDLLSRGFKPEDIVAALALPEVNEDGHPITWEDVLAAAAGEKPSDQDTDAE